MRLAILLLALALLPLQAAAQDRAFVQIEAHPSLVEAQARARDYARRLGEVNGFALGGAWYGVALGPYAADAVRATLERLRGQGLIPRDSFVSDGGGYGDRFWPAGLGSGPDAAPVAAVDGGATPAIRPASVAPVAEETEAEALRSEAALPRDDKMALQRALQWLGFYDAAIDGDVGAGTRAAMADWQASVGARATGVLTTRQRGDLRAALAAAQAALGLAPLAVPEAGIALTAPMGLVAFDRIEAPFVHYLPRGDGGVRLSLISQAGDATTLAGLYEVLQTLDLVPRSGERSRDADGFRITGLAPDRTTQVVARFDGDHIVGFVLSWPEAQDGVVARALPEMERTLASTGPALPADAGFEADAQRLDTVSGLAVRRPLREASGFWVDAAGAVATAAAAVEGCGRITLDGVEEARVAFAQEGAAILRPDAPLAPVAVAALALTEGRLRSAVSVGGFPYGGVLGTATLAFGTLEDVRGLDGDDAVLRLSVRTRAGDAGGPVLDASGRVAGMLLPDAPGDARALPGDVAFALKARRLETVLGNGGIRPRLEEPGGPIAPEDLAARAAGLTVLVSCWE